MLGVVRGQGFELCLHAAAPTSRMIGHSAASRRALERAPPLLAVNRSSSSRRSAPNSAVMRFSGDRLVTANPEASRALQASRALRQSACDIGRALCTSL